MAIDNVYDIYNATLHADQPTVDAIVTAILTQLEASIAADISVFDYDITDHVTGMEGVKINRIVDRVLAILRDKGIHAQTKAVPMTYQDPSVDYPYYQNYFNNMQASLMLITVKWYTRNSQEYMKTYV